MNNYIRGQKILFFINFLQSLIVIFLAFLFSDAGDVPSNKSLNNIFLYIVPSMVVVLFAISFTVLQKQFDQIKQIQDISTKLYRYNFFSLMRLAAFGGVALFASVVFYITMNDIHIGATLIVLIISSLFYPTNKKAEDDLGLNSIEIEEHLKSKTPTIIDKKTLWIIPALIIVIIYNTVSFPDLFEKNNTLPNIIIDKGTVVDSIYTNKYLGWTFEIPEGYSVTPVSIIEKNQKQGREVLNLDEQKVKSIPLLNISKSEIDFRSMLNYRAAFPQLKTEEEYFDILQKVISEADTKGTIDIKSKERGDFLIDSLHFKYHKYSLFVNKNQIEVTHLSKFNKEIIFDIILTSNDSIEENLLIEQLKKSKLNWE